MKVCSIPGCGISNHIRKGLCEKHYARVRKHGTPDLPVRKTIAERFHEKYEIVTESGCWIWTGAVGGNGYGALQLGTREQEKTHRLSWLLHFGEIPKGLFVCHRCDTPLCVNPHHLFLGTCKENGIDMANKGRSRHGEKNATAKLKESDIARILADSRPATELCYEYGVHPETIRRLRRGESWTRQIYKRLTFQMEAA